MEIVVAQDHANPGISGHFEDEIHRDDIAELDVDPSRTRHQIDENAFPPPLRGSGLSSFAGIPAGENPGEAGFDEPLTGSSRPGAQRIGSEFQTIDRSGGESPQGHQIRWHVDGGHHLWTGGA